MNVLNEKKSMLEVLNDIFNSLESLISQAGHVDCTSFYQSVYQFSLQYHQMLNSVTLTAGQIFLVRCIESKARENITKNAWQDGFGDSRAPGLVASRCAI